MLRQTFLQEYWQKPTTKTLVESTKKKYYRQTTLYEFWPSNRHPTGSVLSQGKEHHQKATSTNVKKISSLEEHLVSSHGPFEHVADFLMVSDLVALSHTNKKMHQCVSLRLRHWKCEDHWSDMPSTDCLFQGQGVPFECESCGVRSCSSCKDLCKACDKASCWDCEDLKYCELCDGWYHAQCTYTQTGVHLCLFQPVS